MKKLIYFAITTAFAMVSCTETPEVPVEPGKQITASFSSNISPMDATRVVNDQWESTDKIGLYMKPAGEALASSLTKNMEMSISGSSSLTPVQTIFYPAEGNVDFIAYYPYVEMEDGYSPIVAVLDQSRGLAQEFLYSNNATNRAATSDMVALNFNYSLAKIYLTVTASADSDFTADHFENMTVAIGGMYSSAGLLIDDGTLWGHSTNGDQDITMYKADYTATSATFEALILPVDMPTEAMFNFTVGGKTYSLPVVETYEAGMQYNLAFTLDVSTPPEPVIALVGATITPRTPENRDYTLTVEELGLPTNLQVSEQTVNSNGQLARTFTWNAVDGAEYYELNLYESPSEGAEPVLLAQTENTYVDISGFTIGVEYEWTVSAVSGYEKTEAVAGPSFATQDVPLVPPTNLRIENLFSTDVTLKWDAATAADDYVIEWDGEPMYITLGETSFYMQGLTPATTYTFRVATVRGEGAEAVWSDWSELLTVITPASAQDWDYASLNGNYTANGVPSYLSEPWPSSWGGTIAFNTDYKEYWISDAFSTPLTMFFNIKDARLFLNDTFAIGSFTDVPDSRIFAIGLYEQDGLLYFVPRTGTGVEIAWDSQARTLTFPPQYNGYNVIFGLFSYIQTPEGELIQNGVVSDFYADLVFTIDPGNGGTSMSGQRISKDSIKIKGITSSPAIKNSKLNIIDTSAIKGYAFN